MSESESTLPENPIAVAGSEPEPMPASDVQHAPEPTPEPALAQDLEPQPAADPADPSDRVVAVLERLEDRLDESQRLLARQTDIATSLHAENQRLKAGELRSAQLPLVRDLMRVQDVLEQVLEAAVESTAADDLRIARDAILEALARNGIEPTRGESGDPLDPRMHRVIGVEPVDDPAADRTIAEVVKTGFSWEDATTIRAADVRVYKHAPVAPAPPSSDPAPDATEAQP